MAFWSDPDFYRKQNYCLIAIIVLSIIWLYIPLNDGTTMKNDYLGNSLMVSSQIIFAFFGLILHKNRKLVSNVLNTAFVAPFSVVAFFLSLKDFSFDKIMLPSFFLLPGILVAILFASAVYFIKQDIKLLQRSERLWN